MSIPPNPATQVRETVTRAPLQGERALLQAVAGGDQAAFGQLFHHYHPVIYTAVLRIMGAEQAAEEICQDSFLKAWLNRESLIDSENFGGWLYRVAANLSYDALRRQEVTDSHNTLVSEHYQATLSFTPTETLILEKEYANLLQGAVDSLPEKQQQAFILVKQQGLTREQAADAMGVSPETVKTNLKAATQKVRSYCVARMGIIGSLLLAWASRQ